MRGGEKKNGIEKVFNKRDRCKEGRCEKFMKAIESMVKRGDNSLHLTGLLRTLSPQQMLKATHFPSFLSLLHHAIHLTLLRTLRLERKIWSPHLTDRGVEVRIRMSRLLETAFQAALQFCGKQCVCHESKQSNCSETHPESNLAFSNFLLILSQTAISLTKENRPYIPSLFPLIHSLSFLSLSALCLPVSLLVSFSFLLSFLSSPLLP